MKDEISEMSMRRIDGKPFVLVLMPFDEKFAGVYARAIRAGCDHVGACCQRVDEQLFDGNILEQIYNQIASADIIVADMTGRNPNVYYEVGYAKALDKHVVLITQDMNDIPYDLRLYPHIVYGDNESLVRQLKTKLQWCIENPKDMLLQTLEGKRAFPRQLVRSALRAQKFVLDTNLIEEKPRELNSPYAEYRQILESRLRKGEIAFRRVEAVYTKERLERIVRRLLANEGRDLFIKHYEPPLRAMPLLQMMSFDDKDFYLGGFYSEASPSEERVLYIRQPEVARCLQEYWSVLWMNATSFHEGDAINWHELGRIGKRLGLSDEEFEQMVSRLKNSL